MANQYIRSDLIDVFPAGFRADTYSKSKLTSEENLIRLRQLSQHEELNSYFIRNPYANDQYILGIYGYQFILHSVPPATKYAFIRIRTLNEIQENPQVTLPILSVLANIEEETTQSDLLDDGNNFTGLGFTDDLSLLTENDKYIQIRNNNGELIFSPSRLAVDEIANITKNGELTDTSIAENFYSKEIITDLLDAENIKLNNSNFQDNKFYPFILSDSSNGKTTLGLSSSASLNPSVSNSAIKLNGQLLQLNNGSIKSTVVKKNSNQYNTAQLIVGQKSTSEDTINLSKALTLNGAFGQYTTLPADNASNEISVHAQAAGENSWIPITAIIGNSSAKNSIVMTNNVGNIDGSISSALIAQEAVRTQVIGTSESDYCVISKVRSGADEGKLILRQTSFYTPTSEHHGMLKVGNIDDPIQIENRKANINLLVSEAGVGYTSIPVTDKLVSNNSLYGNRFVMTNSDGNISGKIANASLADIAKNLEMLDYTPDVATDNKLLTAGGVNNTVELKSTAAFEAKQNKHGTVKVKNIDSQLIDSDIKTELNGRNRTQLVGLELNKNGTAFVRLPTTNAASSVADSAQANRLVITDPNGQVNLNGVISKATTADRVSIKTKSFSESDANIYLALTDAKDIFYNPNIYFKFNGPEIGFGTSTEKRFIDLKTKGQMIAGDTSAKITIKSAGQDSGTTIVGPAGGTINLPANTTSTNMVMVQSQAGQPGWKGWSTTPSANKLISYDDNRIINAKNIYLDDCYIRASEIKKAGDRGNIISMYGSLDGNANYKDGLLAARSLDDAEFQAEIDHAGSIKVKEKSSTLVQRDLVTHSGGIKLGLEKTKDNTGFVTLPKANSTTYGVIKAQQYGADVTIANIVPTGTTNLPVYVNGDGRSFVPITKASSNRGGLIKIADSNVEKSDTDKWVRLDANEYAYVHIEPAGRTSYGSVKIFSANEPMPSSAQYVCTNESGYAFVRSSTSSDKRLKENIKDFNYEKSILELPVKRFDFIDGEKNQIGCIAQDLQELYPELIEEDNDGYLRIKENKLVYLLIEEVKQLKAEISELKARLN